MQPTGAVQSMFQTGWQAHRQGRLDEAASAYEQVLRLEPRHFAALHMLGVVWRQRGDSPRAAELIARAIDVNPKVAAAYINLGNALQDLGRPREALMHFDKALAMQPGMAEIHLNRGNALSDLYRYAEAVSAYDAALRLNPGLAEAHSYRAKALHELGRLEEALAGHDAALALRPDFGDAWFSKAETQLLLGDLKNGWDSYEWRKRKAGRPAANRVYPQPLLMSPAGLEGKTVLVHWEQGLGDALQGARYLRLLEEAGARVLFAPQPQLRTLMGGLDGAVSIVEADDPAQAFDLHVPLLSLPRIFASTLETIPARIPYLRAPAGHVARWRERIGSHGFKIGICWQGNPAYKLDAARRSFPLCLFEGLSRLDGVRLISVHKGVGESQMLTLPDGMRVETPGPDFAAGPDGFLDTAAVISVMDLVITSDTVIPHLAGAMGAPVWTALAKIPDWRWLLERSDSPWYPTMRLFRQKQFGDWAGVMGEIEAALREKLRAHA